jgi:hypothetical protein
LRLPAGANDPAAPQVPGTRGNRMVSSNDAAQILSGCAPADGVIFFKKR